jgi:type II secretory ATPase GspE/PulE/Tfp pilus assembly ATPase PilB-like protein
MHAGCGSPGIFMVMPDLAALVPVAAIEVPSFQAVPWGPLALTTGLCLAIAACIIATGWVQRTGVALGADEAGRWNLIFGVIGLVLLAGCVTRVPWVVPAVAPCLAVAGMLFIRAKDAGLPEGRRVLAKGGLRNLAAELRPHVAPWTKGAADRGPPRSLKEQVTDLIGGWRRRLTGTTTKTQSGKRQGKAVASAEAFSFLKKDGTVVMTISPGGKSETRVSPHVLKAQQLLQSIIRANAATLSFEPADNRYDVKAHARGSDKSLEKIGSDEARGVMATLKVMADMAGTDADTSRQGTFGVLLRGVRYQIDVESTGPATAERMLLRLKRADAAQHQRGLESLGFRPKVLAQLREAVSRPYGMLLVVGPSGTGRTTTLYAALRELDARKRKIMTVESPVQQPLDDIVQIEVDLAGGATVASVLQMVMRKDPDVVMVGDLDDRKTCEIAMQAALTGHFVFATFEARDTIDALTRLLDLGVEPMLVQTAVTAILAQRLARRLCPKCKVPCEPPEALVRKFNLKPGAIKHIYKEKGCDACGQTGFHGVVPVHELLVMNDQIRKLITAKPSARDLKAAAVLSGTLTMQIDGLTKVVHGDTTVNEILRVTG